MVSSYILHMEWFDVLTPEGAPTGNRLPRQEVHRTGAWHRSVHIWASRSDGALLLQRRSASKDSYPDTWDISCAGHMDAGETPLSAACREFQEELGLTVAPTRLLWRASIREGSILQQGAFIDNEFHEVYTILLSDVEAASVKWDPGELSGIRWITLQQLQEELQSNPQDYAPHPAEYGLLPEWFATSPTMHSPQFLQTLASYRTGPRRLRDAWLALPNSARHWIPGPGKWSVHQVVVHLADTELHFALRVRYALAQPNTVITPFDQDAWAQQLDYVHTDPDLALGLFESACEWTATLLDRSPSSSLQKEFIHPERGPLQVERFILTMHKHLETHLSQIQRIQGEWERAGRPD